MTAKLSPKNVNGTRPKETKTAKIKTTIKIAQYMIQCWAHTVSEQITIK